MAVAAVTVLAVARLAVGALPMGTPHAHSTSALLFPHPGSTACTHRLRTYYCAAGCGCAPAGGCHCAAADGSSAAASEAAAATAAGALRGRHDGDGDGTAFTAFDGTPFRALGGVPALAAGGHVALLSDAGVRVNALFVAGRAASAAAVAAAGPASHPLLMRSVGLLGATDALRIHACGHGRLCASAGAVTPTEVAGADAAVVPSPRLAPLSLTPGRSVTLPGGAVVTAARWPRGDVAYVTLGGVYQVRVAAVTAPWAPRQLELAVRLVGVPSAPSGLLGRTVERVLPDAAPAAASPEGDEAWAVGGLFSGAPAGLDRYADAPSAAAAAAASAMTETGTSSTASRRQLLGVGAGPGAAWAEATSLAD